MAEFFVSPESQRLADQALLRREREFARSREQVRANPQIAERLLAADQLSPSTSSELKQAYALSGMSEDQFVELAGREQTVAGNDGGLMARIGGAVEAVGLGFWDQAIKPLVRGAFTVVDTASKELQRPITASLATATGDADSFGEAYQDIGNTPGLVAVGNLFDDDPETRFDLGQGFFATGQAGEESDRQNQLDIAGQQSTFGRAITEVGIGEQSLYHRVSGNYATPGDTAYDVMAGITQFAGDVIFDPVALGTMGATRAITASKGLTGVRTLGKARRGIQVGSGRNVLTGRTTRGLNDLAEDLGMVSGAQRRSLLAETAERYIGANSDMLDELAAADPYTIMRRMKTDRLGATGDELSDLIVRLGDETDPANIADTLIDAARRGNVRDKGFYRGQGRFTPNIKESWRNMRLSKDLPEARYGSINPSRTVSHLSPMEAATDVDATLRLAKVGEATRAVIVNRAIRARDGAEMLNVVDDTVRAIGRRMEDIGVKQVDVDELIESNLRSRNRATQYLVDEASRPSPPPWATAKKVTIQGVEEEIDAPTAAMISHFNKQGVPLPEPQDVRRATAKLSGLRAVYASNGWSRFEHASRLGSRYLFKFPTLFTRLAYPIRNNLDNQARAAAGGYHSIMTNPVSWWNLGVGRGKRRRFLDLIEQVDGTLAQGRQFRIGTSSYGAVDKIEDGMASVRMWGRDGAVTRAVRPLDELQGEVTAVTKTFDDIAYETGALTKTASGMWQSSAAMKAGAYRTFTNGTDPDFVRAWRTQLGRFHNDPVARAVADFDRFPNREALVNHLVDSGAIDEVARLGDEASDFFYRGADDLGGARGADDLGGAAARRPDLARVDEYIDYIDGHIKRLTNDDPGLRSMLASGDLHGVQINDLGQSSRLDQVLREQYLAKAAPRYVSGEEIIVDGNRAKGLWKTAADDWVDIMASRPENHFTRFPLLAEGFADDLSRSMVSLGDDTLRRDLVERASRAGFDDDLFPQIAQAAQKATGQKGAVLDVEDVIDAAKMHSTDEMLSVAFDATKRSSFQEMADVAVPFWDAFAEVGTSWGRLLRDNPAAFSRGTSAMDSLRDTGVTYVNEYGEEVFNYPLGGALAKFLGMEGQGKPRFEGRLTGLNLMVQGFGPGVGPMVQWGASALLPDSPDVQWIRDIITPYGTDVQDAGDLTDPGLLIGELVPAWFEKTINVAREGKYDEHAYNSAIGDAVKVLATTGDYDPADPDSMDRLEADAQRAGRWTMFIRSMLQMGAPTGPGVTWDVQTDPDGTIHRLNTMASAWHEILEVTGDVNTTNAAFIEMYGVEPFWITQGKTNQLRPGPRTREGYNWIGRHPDAAERHQDVIGYFVPPEDAAAPPDYGVYRARLQAGDIQTLTAEQQIQLANKTKARSMYNVVRDRTESLPSGQRRRTLSSARAVLDEQFPSWQSDVLGVGEKLDRDEQIRRLEQAAADPELSDSPVTDPLRAYLALRGQVTEELARRQTAGGAKTLGASANEDLANWLYDRGSAISQRAPAFQGVWQRVFSSEVE